MHSHYLVASWLAASRLLGGEVTVNLLINAPHDNYSKPLGISKTKQNHSIYSVSRFINKVLRIVSCSPVSSK